MYNNDNILQSTERKGMCFNLILFRCDKVTDNIPSDFEPITNNWLYFVCNNNVIKNYRFEPFR